MNGWQNHEDAVIEMEIEDTRTKAPIDPGTCTVVVTFTKPDKSTVEVPLSESEGVWSATVLWNEVGPWVPRLLVTGSSHAKRRLPTINVGDD